MGVLKSVVNPRMTHASQNHNFIGAPSFAVENPGYSFLNTYQSDAYASIYPSVKSIVHEFMTIQPYAIDANGKRKENVPAVNALYHPNQLDSSVAFFEKLAVMNLTHRKTYVLVWRREGNEAKPGGDLNQANIAGYTFLEYPAVTRRDGRTLYTIGSQEFDDTEVMVIPGGVDPYNLYGGFAPGEASRRWAKLEDYIADFQAGFFENGAVPAGQFIITAASKKDYEDTVDMMQARHRGAGNNNNVTYTPRPIDPNTGKPSDAKIEWIPFASTNREIDFKNLFEQANRRVDSVFGVPASVRGVGENNNYATARTDQQNFIRFAVSPLALRIYTQITHELNRITGGLGVAITYHIELPAIADEEKVQAETKNEEVNAIKGLLAEGFSLNSIVDALELPVSYKSLQIETTKTIEEIDTPDVDEGDEVNESPDPEKIDGVTKLKSTVKPIIKDQLKREDVESYEHRMQVIIRDHMSKQINKAVDDLDASNKKEDLDEAAIAAFTNDMMIVIVESMVAAGTIQYDEGISLLVAAGINTDDLSSFTLKQSQQDAYNKYLEGVAESYGEDTGESIRNVLSRGNMEGWDKNKLQTELRKIMDTDEWRVIRLATSEINRSQDMGSVYSMRQIQDESEATIERSLLHTGSDEPCEFCRVYIDNWIPVDSDMISKGDVVTGADGGILIYTWDDNEGHDVHANGHCVPQFRVVRNATNSFNREKQTIEEQKKVIATLEDQLEELDGRSKEAKELKAQVKDMQEYIEQLESIIDGQG